MVKGVCGDGRRIDRWMDMEERGKVFLREMKTVGVQVTDTPGVEWAAATIATGWC